MTDERALVTEVNAAFQRGEHPDRIKDQLIERLKADPQHAARLVDRMWRERLEVEANARVYAGDSPAEVRTLLQDEFGASAADAGRIVKKLNQERAVRFRAKGIREMIKGGAIAALGIVGLMLPIPSWLIQIVILGIFVYGAIIFLGGAWKLIHGSRGQGAEGL